jgi:hypothetical protein
MKSTFQRGEKMENLMREIGELQNDYRKLVNGKKLTKRAMCNLVIPFRNKYNLTDLQALQVARNELSILEMADLLLK